MPQHAQRNVAYPYRHLGRLLEEAIERRFPTQSAAARFLGVDKTKFNKWIRGKVHPGEPEDWQLLTRLGAPLEELHRREFMDKLDALRMDADKTQSELVELAISVALDVGASREELAQMIRDAAPEDED